jgi:ABC-type dipeptide/oligopeptide/nickel transport system permease component
VRWFGWKARFIARRLSILVLQVWGIVTTVFVLIQLLPGDPIYLLAGGLATDEERAALARHLGLNSPIHERYFKYIYNVLHGDLGTSYFTSKPVLEEVLRHFTATLELITFAFVLAVAVGVPLGIWSAVSQKGPLRQIPIAYAMVAGALPEFWWALMLILMFFVTLGVAPAPIGRVDITPGPPQTITGIYTLDALVTGNMSAFRSSLVHLILPVVTLAFINAAPIVKVTRTQMSEVMASGFVRYARACGMPQRRIYRDALKNALLPVITFSGLTYGYLVSAAILVETVFSWGGLGQFTVQSVANSDYLAVAGSVMFIAIFALTVYVVMDILQTLVDPRTNR